MHGLTTIAESLGMDKVLRLCGIHGIRWQASLLRAVTSIRVDFVALAVTLHTIGECYHC